MQQSLKESAKDETILDDKMNSNDLRTIDARFVGVITKDANLVSEGTTTRMMVASPAEIFDALDSHSMNSLAKYSTNNVTMNEKNKAAEAVSSEEETQCFADAKSYQAASSCQEWIDKDASNAMLFVNTYRGII